MFRYFKDLEK